MKPHVPTKFHFAFACVGLLAGFALPFGQGGCGDCPPERQPASQYHIVTDRADWIQGSGRVAVSETTILVTYETVDGTAWEVEYEVSALNE